MLNKKSENKNKESKVKNTIKDYNGIVINDKPIKASKVKISISVEYEGKHGIEEYDLDSYTLDNGLDVDSLIESQIEIDWEA